MQVVALAESVGPLLAEVLPRIARIAAFIAVGVFVANLLVAVTINTFFGFVQHVFTFYAPVLVP